MRDRRLVLNVEGKIEANRRGISLNLLLFDFGSVMLLLRVRYGPKLDQSRLLLLFLLLVLG
jgi:hypothetical protein